jgi:general secretion pathway protein G
MKPLNRIRLLRRERLGPGAFTILELMIVITLIMILATLAIPSYKVSVQRARETVLKDDLFTMRKLIDQYTLDKQKPPDSLDDLVTAGYLRDGLPVDPFTQSNQTWNADIEEVSVGSEEPLSGVVDVHSGSDEISLEGTPYNSW